MGSADPRGTKKGCRKLTTLDAMANRKGTERRNQESNNEK
jgi:hypothetical protein